MATARCTNGKAKPSLRPASEVRAKRASPSSPDRGGPTWTSEASTGSVGARAPPSSRAEARPSPRPWTPIRVTATMLSGMVTAISRQDEFQRRQPIRRSIFSPAPISETITTISVSRSVRVENRTGSERKGRTPPWNTTTPISTQRMASDSGRRLSAIGSHATSSTTTPRPSRNSR
jgi:hypothetical protein